MGNSFFISLYRLIFECKGTKNQRHIRTDLSLKVNLLLQFGDMLPRRIEVRHLLGTHSMQKYGYNNAVEKTR